MVRLLGPTILAVLLQLSPAATAMQFAATEVSPTDAIEDDIQAGRTASALKRLDALAKSAHRPEQQVAIAMLRGVVLTSAGRFDAAEDVFLSIERTSPGLPLLVLGRLELFLQSGQIDHALRALDRLSAAFPDVARDLDKALVRGLFGQLHAAKRRADADRVTLALARVGWSAGGVAWRDANARKAAEISLKLGDVAAARRFALSIDSVRPVQEMLINRRFAALWPELAERAGPHLEWLRTRAAEEAERGLAAATENVFARRAVVVTYREQGRFAEADRVATDFATDPATVAALDEDGGWLVNDHALVLHAMNRADAADARFAALAVRGIEAAPWLISMVINRAELRVADGRYAEALPLLTAAVPLADRHGSPYARQLVRRLQTCALFGLGRRDEAEALMPAVLAHAEDATTATLDALTCAGQNDAAAARLIALLGDDAHRDDMVRALQPMGVFFQDDPSIWSAAYLRLATRPDVRAAFEAAGRIMPDSLRFAPAVP